MSPTIKLFNTEIQSRINQLNIHGHNLHWHGITNIDELYNTLILQGESHEDVIDERIPYWTELWPSAIALAQFIAENQKVISHEINIHEIGCGLALPSLLCGKLGFKVLMSDYLLQPLQFATENWKLNCDMPPQSLLLDWRSIPATVAQSDLILAADVAYEKRMFEPLLHAYKRLVKPNGTILFTEPNRKLTQPFYALLKDNGFAIKSEVRLVDFNNFKHTINLNQITLTEAKPSFAHFASF
jgi:predicted nicotinamide N-methyase